MNERATRFNAAAGVLALLLAVSCAAPSPRVETPPLSPEEARSAEAEAVRREAREGGPREVRREGRRFLERHPESPEAADVRLLTGAAALELGFLEEAAEIVAPLEDTPVDSVRIEALTMLAEVDVAKGRFSEAVGRLLGILASGPPPAAAAASRERLAGLVPLLSERDLESVAQSHPDAPGIELIHLGSLSIAEAKGDTAAVRYIRERLQSLEAAVPPPSRPAGRADVRPTERKTVRPAAGAIGLLCPLSGRYAALGEEFVRGARIAALEAREYGAEGIELVAGDTRSSPLDSRDAAVRLIADERVRAIVGGILSSTTITAAQVAENAGVVLYSPLASEEGIDEIGPHVFQAPSDLEAELAAVVRAARREMGLVRFAMLAVDSQRQRRTAALLRREVEACGGTLCAVEYYDQGSTDFKEQIDRLREAAVEALFIPSDTEDLVLILPQLSFYEFGVQLLGTSAWDSGRLLRMAGRDMEGAVFPAGAGEGRLAERYLAACALVGEDPGDANRFVAGGYEGVRAVIEALGASATSGLTVREEMERAISMRRHRFLELVEGEGIPLVIVRSERAAPFATIGGSR